MKLLSPLSLCVVHPSFPSFGWSCFAPLFCWLVLLGLLLLWVVVFFPLLVISRRTRRIRMKRLWTLAASCMSMSNGNRRRYTTISTPESRWTKVCTRRDGDDELRAMQDCGVYVEMPIREAVAGKHIRGFPIAHMKGDRVDVLWPQR